MAKQWCAVCGSAHDLSPKCPGEIPSTGTERFGWRIAIEAGLCAEEYGILIAPSNKFWRARILTFPNMLWSVPGGRATIKFMGRSATDAEARAKNYILEIVRKRGYKKSKSLPHSKIGSIRPDGAQENSSEPRSLHEIKVKFGEAIPDREGTTGDLSMSGLSIVTDRPLPQGRRVKAVIYMDGATLRLQGNVIWTRSVAEEGRAPGMGLHLQSPPALYRHYVTKLTGAPLDEPELASIPQGAELVADGQV